MAGQARFTDEAGKVWDRRLKQANAVYKRASKDWEKLRKFHAAATDQRRRWGTSISLARTITDGLVADTYVRNPDPFIQSLTPIAPDSESSIRDLFRTLLEDTDTETVMKRADTVSCVTGLAGHWADFEQEDDEQDSYETQVSGTAAEDAATMDAQQPRPQPKAQRVTGDLVMPQDLRFDPDGRSWLLKDHKWIARLYTRTLQEILDDTSGCYSDEGKQKLREWLRGRKSQIRPESRTREQESVDGYEKDDAYRQVNLWEIWSRVDRMIYHQPVTAEFQVGSYPWKKAWALSGQYPLTIHAHNWQMPDENGEDGFYPLPDLRKVASQLDNLPRLEAAFLDSVTNSAKKYLSIKGLLAPKELAAFQTDENRQILEIDLTDLAKKIAGGGQIDLSTINLRDLFVLIPQEDRAEAGKHLEALQHEIDLIFMNFGMGPSDRGGLPDSETATDSLGVQERLASRRDVRTEESARTVDRICEKYWLLIKHSATLPIAYRRAAGVTESTWSVIQDPMDQFAAMDLVFRHHVGSSRPPNRETVKAERKEIFSLAGPVLQANGDVSTARELLWWMVDAFDHEFATRLLNTDLATTAQEILLMIDQFQQGSLQITPDNVTQLLDTVSHFLRQYLSPGQIQQVAQQAVAAVGNGAPGPAQQGMGSMAKPATTGQAAFARGAAGAGMTGGR